MCQLRITVVQASPRSEIPGGLRDDRDGPRSHICEGHPSFHRRQYWPVGSQLQHEGQKRCKGFFRIFWQVVDLVTGEELGDGETGELCFQGPQVSTV